jgi:hypothetical protein
MEEELFIPNQGKPGPPHALGFVEGIEDQNQEGQKKKYNRGDKYGLGK